MATTLSVYKPRGMTPYGRGTQHEQGVEPDRGLSNSTPRWVDAIGIIAFVLLFVIRHLTPVAFGATLRDDHRSVGPIGLTPPPLLRRLGFVHRIAAILLGSMLVLTAGQGSALHIHAYADHDHPEHHRGLAAHDHHRSLPDRDNGGLRVESCDPGVHALTLVMGRAQLPQAHVIDTEGANPTIGEPLVPLRVVNDLTDVRVHGPPPRLQSPPRAPPLIVRA